MLDPYEILGVGREATTEQIRAAYRQRAKQLHPDAGGNDDEFDRLHRCYKALIDPKQRAEFDSTGKMPANNPDIHMALVLSLIAWSFDQALGQVPAGGDAADFNVINMMRDALRDHLRVLGGQEEHGNTVVAAYKRLAGRFKTIDGEPGQLNAMVEHKIALNQSKVASVKRDRANTAEALEFLADYMWIMGRMDERIDAPRRRLGKRA